MATFHSRANKIKCKEICECENYKVHLNENSKRNWKYELTSKLIYLKEKKIF